MRIGIILYKFGSEADFGAHLGSFHYVVKKVTLLGETGHQIFVIAPWVSFWRRGSVKLGNVQIIRYWPPLFNNPKLLFIHWLLRLLYLKLTQRAVLSAVKQYQLDAVYVRQAREAGFAVAKIKHRLGVPFIFRQITAWQWHFERPLNPIRAWLVGRAAQIRYAKAIYQHADQLVFSTHGAAAAETALGLDLKKVTLLPEAVEEAVYAPTSDQAAIRRELQLPTGNIVLYLGRLNIAEKGIDYLIRAAALAVKQIPDFHLVVVGGGSAQACAAIQRLVDDLGAASFVHILGKRPFTAVPAYINAANLVVVPSVWPEAFGRITVEAMSCGVPVITSDTGGSPEVNLGGQTGLVVPAADSTRLAEAMVSILANKERAAAMGAAGRQRVLANYTYERIIERFLAIITSAVDSHYKL